MSLYRPTWKKDGREGQSKFWWFEYREPTGLRVRVNLKVSDRRAAELKSADILRKVELKDAGVTDPFERHRGRAIAEHVAEFETSLRSRKVVLKYADDRLKCLRAFVTEAEPRLLADLDGPRASEWLAKLSASGLSARSVNRRRAALCQFGRWLMRERRMAWDPFVGLSALNEDVDRRRPRRALTMDEIDRLLEAAKARPLFEARTIRVNAGVSETEERRLRELGETRAFVYLMAFRTGLRRGELSRVRWCDVDLVKGVVNVPAASAKSKRDQSVELRSDLILLLKARRGTGPATSLVLDAKTFPNLRTFKKDCALAGIQVKDDQGRTVDFHGLRTTLGSHLAAAGVHPAVAKAILRHSTIELTMKYYTDVRLLDTRGALERLPGAGTGAGHGRAV